MPYDLPFERITKTDDESALELNKLLASALVTTFSEINDLNTIDSGARFTQFVIDSDDEFPERHFRLWAELHEMIFGFEFWKDTLWLELGASGNPTIRFVHVHKYAEFMVQHGFAVHDISNSKMLPLDEGLIQHQRAYTEWIGFVEYVSKATTTMPFQPEQ